MGHHLTGNEGQLCEVDNEPQREVTAETDVGSATCLEEGGLSMENLVCVRIHETSLHMQMNCYRSQDLGEDPGAVAKPKGSTFHW